MSRRIPGDACCEGGRVALLCAIAPVIVIAAAADVEIARKTVEAGAFDFATKPVDLRRVHQFIDEALQHSPELL